MADTTISHIFGADLTVDEAFVTTSGSVSEIDITAASAYLAARVTVMGISVSGSYLWSWTDPPKISRLVGDTLVLSGKAPALALAEEKLLAG